MSVALDKGAVVAVIGAGTMGRGIAQVAATAGHRVLIHDAIPGAADKAIVMIREELAMAAARGKGPGDPAEVAARLSAASAIGDLAPAALAIEAIIEKLDAKVELFRALEEILSPEAILATNTSSFSVTQIGGALARPERLVGMHFFNPAHILKLVEVVRGLATDAGVVDTIVATADAWGKDPIVTASTPGFIVNRVARPFYGEALRLLEEGVADHETIDRLMTAGAGFKMGPFALTDLIGQDVNYAVSCSVFEAFQGDWRYRPSLLQKELVDAGRLGRKSGRGWYSYPLEAGGSSPLVAIEPPRRIVAFGDLGPAEPLVERLAAAGTQVVREGAAVSDPHIRVGEVRLALTDGRTAAERGDPGLVLFDLVPDFSTTRAMALAAIDKDGGPVRVARDLFASVGIEGVPVADLPGLVVARTLAMLVNEAADAVHLGVADPAAVDTAMRKGVNYPIGLLAFGERLGAPYLCGLIDRLADFYREPRYRASARLRRQALLSERRLP